MLEAREYKSRPAIRREEAMVELINLLSGVPTGAVIVDGDAGCATLTLPSGTRVAIAVEVIRR